MEPSPERATSDSQGAMIRLEQLTKRYGSTTAVDHLDLDVAEGELCVLVGPSGCGKTTTMKMINRIIEPTSGRILLDGEDVTHTDPVALRRRIGYVIQQIGLFPHRKVRDNVATVPRLVGWKKGRTDERVDELLTLVGLDPAVHGIRYPHELSGGQRQRVGVARALAADPPVLLMDEPFGAVDPIARGRLQEEFLRLQQQVRKTIVFVTHDIEEAVRLGDRIAVLREGGVLEQHADPATLLGAPANDFVADFVGADRGLKRLAVTPLATDDLVRPLQVSREATLSSVRQQLAGATTPVLVVDGGRVLGVLPADRLAGEGAAGDRVVACSELPAEVTLKQVMSALLREDAGAVVVQAADGPRVVTPAAVHAALRRSVHSGHPEVADPDVREA